MYLLPLLAGVLLAVQGPHNTVLGIENDAAPGEGSRFNSRPLDLVQKILERIRYEKRSRERVPTWDDSPVEVSLDDKSLDGINLAAEDETNNVIKTDEETKTDKGANKVSSVDNKTTTPPNLPPPPPMKQVDNENIENVVGGRDFLFVAILSACSVAGLVGLIMAGVCWYKLHSRVKAASDVDYPAYGVTGPTKERLPSPGDRKLAQSAQMYHYQHQKQQMIAMEKANGEMKHDASEDESEEENEEGDYTVYECPGLAPTGEMEVRNPLFNEEAQTPTSGQSPPTVNGLQEDTNE